MIVFVYQYEVKGHYHLNKFVTEQNEHQILCKTPLLPKEASTPSGVALLALEYLKA